MWFNRREQKKKIVESQQAILNATSELRQVQARDPEVHAVSGALKTIRERNHFAEQLRIIMERG